jgi:hypothetical protein
VEFTIDYYTRNLTVLQFAYSLVITLKTFTINHNAQSRCNTLCTVLILHWVIPCILTCALLAVSLIHFKLNWPTCTLLVLYSYSTGAALPSVSPINAGIQHSENAAPCTVARDVTEVMWSFLTIAPSSVTAQPSNAKQCEARGREGRQDVAALHYCCAIAFLEVSDFYQLPHGAITPHYKESCIVNHIY